MTDEAITEIGALSQDLKRVATFIGRGSNKSAKRFLQEVSVVSKRLDLKTLPPYLFKHIKRLDDLPKIIDPMELAEEALMIGCILQNAAVAAAKH